MSKIDMRRRHRDAILLDASTLQKHKQEAIRELLDANHYYEAEMIGRWLSRGVHMEDVISQWLAVAAILDKHRKTSKGNNQ